MILLDRWLRFWARAKARGDPAAPWETLAAHYGEPHRAYHTLRHIEHCLREFDAVREDARDPVSVEMALWYHDAIYDTRSRDNEEQSAVLAERTAVSAGLPADFARRVGDLIRVSTHRKSAADPDSRLFADVDLAILGQPPDAFWEYERQVREEYAWVPEADFRSSRARILEAFLERFFVYATPAFQEKYEKQARLNLTASLLVLKGASPGPPGTPEACGAV
jgi:predicted metal-dependent HD superfamily phosphohydrolase